MIKEETKRDGSEVGRRGLAAIMFTDIVGYTSLAQKNESLSLKILEEHRNILRLIIPRYNGREVKTMGDSFLIEFASSLEALRCAVGMQQALRDRNLAHPKSIPIQIRIGIHAGDIVHSENDVYGDAVNVASRIEPLAEPGGICFSDQVLQHVRNKIDFQVVSLGRKDLKNVEIPIDVYSVVIPWGKEAGGSPSQSSVVLDKHRVAILPLSNLSADPNDEYFSDGMT